MSSDRRYMLTEEGKYYLEHGLPEKCLIEKLREGEQQIHDFKDKIYNFVVALHWAKKNGWIKIHNNRIVAKNIPKKFPLEDALKTINDGGMVDESTLSLLTERKLVVMEREDIIKRAEKFVGKEITNLTEELIKTKKWEDVTLKPYNVEVTGKRMYPGKKQPYGDFLALVKMKMAFLGFEEISGPLVETEFWNMDALYMPQHHSARDIHDAYFLKNPKYAKRIDSNILKSVKKSHEKGIAGSCGWEYKYDVKRAHRLLLRTHTTVLSAKTLASKPKIPGKYFSVARCFRYDVIDATHLPDFYQIDGIILDSDLNFRHLAGLLRLFAKEFADSTDIKLVPAYFPFTEPSVELHAKHKELGWIELGGAGIFRPELTHPLGIDVPVIAWGLGVDRIFMMKMKINDIRQLFSHDLKYLREARICQQ